MIVDVGVIVFIGIFAIRGFKGGFIPSLLGLAGYLVGGFLGLLGARELSADWNEFWSILGLHLLLIFIGAKIGQSILKSMGRGVRGLVGPLRFLDSICGATLGFGKGLVIAFLVIQVLPTLSNNSIDNNLKESTVVEYFKRHTPTLVDQGFEKLREISR